MFDPAHLRVLAAAKAMTFQKASEQFLTSHAAGWRNNGRSEQQWRQAASAAAKGGHRVRGPQSLLDSSCSVARPRPDLNFGRFADFKAPDGDLEILRRQDID